MKALTENNEALNFAALSTYIMTKFCVKYKNRTGKARDSDHMFKCFERFIIAFVIVAESISISNNYIF